VCSEVRTRAELNFNSVKNSQKKIPDISLDASFNSLSSEIYTIRVHSFWKELKFK
jgi:hypothetical protein